MFSESVDELAAKAAKEAHFAKVHPAGYLVYSALAGVYIAFAITLIFSIGAPLAAAHSPFTKLVMGASFGIALALVIFAGSALFTGTNVVLPLGALRGQISWGQVAKLWGLCYVGNLLGSLLLAFLVVQTGLIKDNALITSAVAAKMGLGFLPAFTRGILCNWLVCLAVWSASRTKNDMAKLTLLFWCLFAFIGSGFEHSVANMGLMAMALFQNHPDTISWAGYLHNLVPVTLGNIVAGAVLVGGAYWFTSLKDQPTVSLDVAQAVVPVAAPVVEPLSA